MGYAEILEMLKKVSVVDAIVATTMYALFISIFINFRRYDKSEEVIKYKKSPVETFTMTLFAVVIYILIRTRTGYVEIIDTYNIVTIIGLIVFVSGCIFNIVGRFYLGSNWSNQVRLRKKHSMVRSGPYGIVRHPLYASIIWMITASGFIYSNVLVIGLNLFVFIPMMTYRAKQEEKVLSIKFDEYEEYKRTTGRFFPKLIRR